MDLFNVEAEQAVLGSILLNNDILSRLPNLKGFHFYDGVHGKIFDLCRQQYEEGTTSSPITLKFLMSDDERLKSLGGPEYLVRLAGASMPSDHAPDYSRVIVEMWTRRTLGECLRGCQERLGASDGGSVMEIAGAAEKGIAAALDDGAVRPLTISFRAGLVQTLEQFTDAYANERPVGVSTGLDRLDSLIGSLAPGRSYVLAGRPSMGKSAAALSIALSVAKAGRHVIFVSLEMPIPDLIRRCLSNLLRAKGMKIPYHAIERGTLTEEEAKAVVLAAKEFEALPLHFISGQDRELDTLKLIVKAKCAALGSIGLIVVDYLQLVAVQSARTSFDRVGQASKAMKSLAMSMSAPLMVLSQLNRGVEDRDNKKPQLSDLRQSGEVEEDADVVVMLYRAEYYLQRSKPTKSDAIADWHTECDRMRNKIEFLVEKNRMGPIGDVMMNCEIKYNWIENQSAIEEGFL